MPDRTLEPLITTAQGTGHTPCKCCEKLIQPSEKCLTDNESLWCSRECWDTSHTFVFVEWGEPEARKYVMAANVAHARRIVEEEFALPDGAPNPLLRIEDIGGHILWQPPICCPHCGSDQIAYSEYVNRMFKDIQINENGVLIFSADQQKMNWEATKDATLWCRTCEHDFPVPDDIELDFQ